MKMKLHGVLMLVLIGMMAVVSHGAEMRILILNAAGVDAKTLESLRAHAENELFVPVAAETVAEVKDSDLKAIGQKLAGKKTATDACLVVLANGAAASGHSVMMAKEQVVVVNVTALQSDDPVKFARRLQRLTLRGVASLFGIGPDMDPHSVMSDYVTLDELDKMGLNFSPPWMDKVRDAAAKRGLVVRPLFPNMPAVK